MRVRALGLRRPRAVQPQDLVDRLLGAVARVEARVRVLEDDLHLAAAARVAPWRERDGVERSRPQAVIVPAVGAVEADEHARDGRLARARLADDRQRAALARPRGRRRRRRRRRRRPCAARWPRGRAQPWRATSGRRSTAARPRGSSARGRRRAPRPAGARRGRRPGREAQRGANGQPSGASNALTGRPGIAVEAAHGRVDRRPRARERRRVRMQRAVVQARARAASRRSARRT